MTSLVEQALARSPDVRQATALVRLARARLREQEGANWPVGGAVARIRSPPNVKPASRLSADADLVRRRRRRKLGSRHLRCASRRDRGGARRLRAGSDRFGVSPSCQWRPKSCSPTPIFAARRCVWPLLATTSPIRRARPQLTEQLLNAGRGTQLDVDRAIALLESTRASIPPLIAAESAAIYRLGVLVGTEPQALSADLRVRRRAACAAGRSSRSVNPSHCSVGGPMWQPPNSPYSPQRLAPASLPPISSLDSYSTADVGLQSFGIGDVDNRGLQFGVGIGVTLPFLEWNRIRQRILAADATAEIAVADYERTALSALEEAERAISAYVQERERFGHLDLSARSARAAAESRPAAIPARRRQFPDSARRGARAAGCGGPIGAEPGRGHASGGLDLQGARRRVVRGRTSHQRTARR